MAKLVEEHFDVGESCPTCGTELVACPECGEAKHPHRDPSTPCFRCRKGGDR